MCASSGTGSRLRVLAGGLKFGLLAVCFGMLSGGLSSLFIQRLGLESSPQDAVSALMRADTSLLTIALIAAAAIIVSPVLEESFFRHFIQRRLVRAMGGNARAAVAVAVLFAVCHWNLAAALPLFVASLFFSAAYFRAGLPCSILAHATHNVVTVVAALLQAS